MFIIIALFAMIGIAITDIRTRSIPDVLTIVILICGILLRIEDQTFPLAAGLIGGWFFAGLWLVSRGTWIGTGDIFLGLALSVFLGTWQITVLMLVLTYVIGATVVLVQLPFHHIHRHSEIPFAPFLISGAVIAFFFGDAIIQNMLFAYMK